jgi:hypothetical protein
MKTPSDLISEGGVFGRECRQVLRLPAEYEKFLCGVYMESNVSCFFLCSSFV